MEPVTHFLTGACLARAGLNRKTALATLTLTLATEAPDIDVVAYLGGSVTGFQHHRGFTHTLLGAPFVAAFVLAGVYGIYRLMGRMGRRPKAPPDWRLLFAFACFGVLVHILQDFTNNYGVRPFMPFTPRWYSWDIVFIVDPVMLLALFLGLFLPGMFSLISEEVGEGKPRFRGRGGARAALICLLILIAVRDFQHRRAMTALKSLGYGGQDALRISAFPNPLNMFSWNGVVETQDAFELLPVNTWAGEIDPHNLAVLRHKPDETPFTRAAKKSRLGRIYLDWAQYPLVEGARFPDGNRYRVTFVDLRFSSAEAARRRRSSPLTGYVILDSRAQVLQERAGGPPPD